MVSQTPIQICMGICETMKSQFNVFCEIMNFAKP